MKISDQHVDCVHEIDGLFRRESEERRPWLALDAATRLGPLAPWWMRPEALELAHQADQKCVTERDIEIARHPARERGLALVTCTWKWGASSDVGNGLLRPTAVLPLRWHRGKRHDGLPPGIADIESAVVSALAEDRQGKDAPDLEGLSLTWAFSPPADVDLSELTCGADSAFFPLAAALYLTAIEQKSCIDPEVWITGAWDSANRVVKEVGGIECKVATMLDFGARQIFVPYQNYERARNAVRELRGEEEAEDLVVRIRFEDTLRAALRPILVELRARPAPEDPFEERVDYHRHLLTLGEDDEAKQYYRDYLLDDVVKGCRERLTRELKRLAKQRPVLVTTSSKKPELVRIAYEVLEAAQVILLRPVGKTEEAADDGILSGIPLVPFDFDHQTPDAAMRSADSLFEYAQRKWPERSLVVDLTPSWKMISLALALRAPRHVPLLYLKHDYYETVREPRPGTETFVVVPRSGGDEAS